jgi:pyruvate/2-oxoglutarate/acetoin dehydrogenase E1 component
MGQVLKQPVVSTYFDELCRAMKLLADNRNTIFMGQGVKYVGTTMTDTLRDVPKERMIEFPVAEDMQMGMALGMSLDGVIPVCIFPRWNFLLCAANQLVNHLDRLPLYSSYKPKVIIRTAVPRTEIFNPGPQHDDDFTQAFRSMLRTVEVTTLKYAESIVPVYQHALNAPHSSLIVEHTALYGN